MSAIQMLRRTVVVGIMAVVTGCGGSGGEKDAGVECLPTETNCNGSCTSLQTDKVNCGACGTVCELGTVCQGGACAATCGDASKAGAEQCDDGNTVSGDGCSATCQLEPGWSCVGSPSACTTSCGDGVVAGAEFCDDGNTRSGDGCRATCAPEEGFTCEGSPSVCTTSCGDGVIVGDEICDDQNQNASDGCSATCQPETGFNCTGEPSVCATVCGDGIIRGQEHCDDGNTVSLDGCSKACTAETGFTCEGEPSACASVCGDGIIVGPESCDDGNSQGGDGCSEFCTIESGYLCNGAPSTCFVVCGDGLVLDSEACDDGNKIVGDGCSDACVPEPGYACTGSPSTCATVCGDGIRVGTEQCDDGALAGGDGCDASCSIEPGFYCSGSPSVCTAILTCGTGSTKTSYTSTDLPKALDATNPTNTSNIVVSGVPGVVTSSAIEVSMTHTYVEDVELSLVAPNGRAALLTSGNGSSGDNFKGTIFVDSASTSITAGTAPFSGPHAPQQSLALLDGPYANGTWQLAMSDLYPPADHGTLTDYRLHLCVCTTCEVGAACADGLDNDGDTAVDCDDSDCAGSGACAVCGNGVVEIGEACDDGNTTDFDGCAANCSAVAPLYTCSGSPSVCTTPVQCPTGSRHMTFAATGLPLGFGSSPSTVQSTIAVSGTDNVAAAHVRVTVAHEWVEDVEMSLSAPDGTSVLLTTANGSSGQHYIDTIFDDAASSSITTGSAPFTGSFRPQSGLSLLNGKPIAGNWILSTTDLFPALDDGAVWAYELSLCVNP